MKKIISILACVCLVLSAMIIPVSAADGVTISFAPDENRISYSTSQQVWQENGITVTNNKGASTTNTRDNLNDDHIRCYKNSEVIIEYPGMKTIVIDSVTYSDNDYAAPWTNSFDASLGTATANDGDVTITLNSAVDSLTFASMSGQGRAFSITVYTGDAPITPPAEDEDDTTTSTATLVDTPVADTAYKFGMIQENKSATDIYYLKGGMDGYYMATSSDITAAIDVYLEETTGGYHLYTVIDGVKSYINMVVSGTHVNGAYEAAASTVYTYDAASKTVVSTVNDATYWFGTRNDKSYTTVGPCATSYNGFYCMFYTTASDDVTPPSGGEVNPPAGDDDDTSELPAPDATNTLTVEEAIELGASQATGAYTTDKYYVTGVVTAVANTQYGNLYIADDEGNEIYVYGIYNSDGTIRYDGLVEQPNEGDTVTLYSVVGNFNGTPQLKNAWLIEMIEGESAPTNPDPEADSELTIEEAIALGESKKSNVYTENKYYVTDVITEVYNDQYGNMYIADENGTTLTVYGTYNEDGSVRYDAMETKPVAGDTITVYGIIGNYLGTAQMKNGWITAIGGAEENVPGIDPENPIQLAVNTSTPATLTEVVVPAGATVFMEAADAYGTLHVTSSTGSYILINGRQNQLTADGEAELVLCGYELVYVYNPSETDTITLYVFLTAGEPVDTTGTMDDPEIITNTGAYSAVVEEGSQGYFYEYTAVADGEVAVTMNDENWVYVVNNITSYVYGDTQWSDSDPLLTTSTVDVKAGDVISIMVNTYDPTNPWNPPAGTVNWTIEFTEKVESAQITVSDAEAVAGKTFTVTIDITNNPGIIGAKLNVNYDVDVLELVSAVAGDFTNGSVNAGDEVIPNYNFSQNITDYPYVINWTDPLATENVTTNGTFAVLTFKVKGTADAGTTEIYVTFDEDDIIDVDLNNVAFETVASTVTITVEDTTSGDVNGDGKINGRDYAVLLQSLNGWDVTIDEDAADVNGDGKVNGRDYAVLLQRLNGWDV